MYIPFLYTQCLGEISQALSSVKETEKAEEESVWF
jgi:hypothetical protein